MYIYNQGRRNGGGGEGGEKGRGEDFRTVIVASSTATVVHDLLREGGRGECLSE